MYKYLLLIIVTFMLVSCSYTASKNVQPNEKAFDQEDTLILFALRAQQIKDHISASKLFESLYEKSSKKEYLYKSLENDLLAKNNKKLIKRANKLLKTFIDDAHIIRLKVISLFELNILDEASTLAVSLSAQTQKPDDYLLTSDILIKRQEYDLAVKYLEGAYVKEYNEKILDKMSIILYLNLGRQKEAIAHLETHSRIHGCSRRICTRLIGFYSQENNIEGLLSTYLRLYKIDKRKEISSRIIQIYTYKKDYISLMHFLEKSKSDDSILLQLYVSARNYKKAYPLSSKLYSKTLDVNYLGQSAIYEYENAKNKNSKELLDRVVTKLNKVTLKDSRPLFLNYLGYILIDHNIDVKKGMTYIDKVLALQPNSSFYLDSKAWGYYKLGECSKAKKIMNRVVHLEGGNDPEVTKHVNAINKCIKNKKAKSKK